MDGDEAGAGITIRPGEGVDSVRVQVPGMPEFETGPQQLRDWLREHNLVHTPQQWTDIDRQLQDAIQGRGQRSGHRHGPGDGAYQWEDYAVRRDQPGLNNPEREAIDEEQTERWNRMLHAWEQFHQQVQDLQSIADGDPDQIIRQVGHVITALNMIENNDWAQPYTDEFAQWETMSPDGIDADRFHTAAHEIVHAGQALHDQWRAAIDAGDYDSYHLTQAQHDFVTHCAQARAALRH
jgi:hypothetical protein